MPRGSALSVGLILLSAKTLSPFLIGNGAFQLRIGGIVNGRQSAATHKVDDDDEVESGCTAIKRG